MPASIKEIRQKIKRFLSFVEQKDVFTILLLVLVAFVSFGLGRLSKIEENKTTVVVSQNTNSALQGEQVQTNGSNTIEPFVSTDKKYVASKNGSSYHFPWCSGAKRIKKSNEVWFATADEAKRAGYTPAGNCKGLD